MNKRILRNKFWLVVILSLVFVTPSVNAFAGDRRGGWSRSLPARHQVVVVNRSRYHYSGGRFYRPSWFGFGFSIVASPIGAIIAALPFGHTTIVVRGTPYYYYDDVYYRPCPSGYVVVQAPAVTQPQSGETITINVPNSNGSFIPVTLVRKGNGYIGPQGEYYPGNPSVDQLRALYGK